MQKRALLILLALLWIIPASACLAENDPALPASLRDLVVTDEASGMLRAAEGADVRLSQGGDVAARAQTGDPARLIVLQRENGRWTAVAENRSLLYGEWDVFMDDDRVFFLTQRWERGWTTVTVRLGQDGVWRFSSREIHELSTDDSPVYDYAKSVSWADETLTYESWDEDENDNIIAWLDPYAVPAGWMAEVLCVSNADEETLEALFPENWDYPGWPGSAALRKAAQELTPSYRWEGGSVYNGLQYLARRPDGEKVLVCAERNGAGWALTVSAPLPENSVYGVENFIDTIDTGTANCEVQRMPDGKWGVRVVYDWSLGDWASLGGYWISFRGLSDIALPQGSPDYVYGSHPWSDITAIDWRALPSDPSMLLQQIDTAGWATVNNPNPADRLHLREEPDRASASLGKYYNGAPVRVLETKGDWTYVDILGETGWMMSRYLAFGEQMKKVSSAMPVYDAGGSFQVSSAPGGAPDRLIATPWSLQILALVEKAPDGNSYWRVWDPMTDVTGYINTADIELPQG